MTKNVPYMTAGAIEQDATALLAEYAQARSVVIAPPIPIEDILEKHLKLKFEFDDTHSVFSIPRSGKKPDILGAMFFDEERIVIDESLDPEEFPAMEGRYRFTLAHEGGGHWRLHRRYFIANGGQPGLFAAPVPPSVICRSSQAKVPVEWQADFYASCLLMPRKLVFAAWNEMFPDGRARVIEPGVRARNSVVKFPPTDKGGIRIDFSDTVEDVFECLARPLAEKFLVSPIAMRIRLEKLELLLREVPHQHLLAGV